MNPYVVRIKKDLVPRCVINGYSFYIGFVHETSEKPLRYYDFTDFDEYDVRVDDVATYACSDYVYPLSISSYFELNDKLMSRGTKYNLMKKRHEYNRRKYGKIRSNNNTV